MHLRQRSERQEHEQWQGDRSPHRCGRISSLFFFTPKSQSPYITTCWNDVGGGEVPSLHVTYAKTKGGPRLTWPGGYHANQGGVLGNEL